MLIKTFQKNIFFYDFKTKRGQGHFKQNKGVCVHPP